MWGGTALKAWSKTQPLIALSSGESELGAVVRASAEALGLKAVLADFGIDVGISLSTDATAAIGIVHRQGLGRVRHLACADLWVQQRIMNRELQVGKVGTRSNCADLMTKPHSLGCRISAHARLEL